jgi:iron complex transport system ATP-binding protein
VLRLAAAAAERRGVDVTPPVWTIDGVSFRHEGANRPTLDDVTFAIERGTTTAFIGPNGAGKSTLIQLLLSVLTPHAGTITLEQRALADWTRREVARRIGVVPQGEVEPLYTVREIVAMGRYPYLGPWQREHDEDARAIARAMDRCDVSAFADRWLSTLSGGERQRVRLARALAQEPSVLVLDEPTTFLDIRHEMSTFELLRRLRGEGTTVVVATHNLNLAARYADTLALLEGGRVVALGTPDEVLTADRISAVYEWPVSIVRHADGAPQVDPRSLDR